jgi:hypothetical protein
MTFYGMPLDLPQDNKEKMGSKRRDVHILHITQKTVTRELA